MKRIIDININVSSFVRKFILADLFLIGGWGLIGPIFAVFIIERVEGATLVTLGIAAAIYWILKSLIQIPVANFLDSTDGERDDFYALVMALIMASMTAFLFMFITKAWHLYLVEVIHAIAFGLYVPSWTGMFSRHLDKKHESLDWSLNSTTVGIASGVTGLLGGWVANAFDFSVVFALAATLSFISAIVIFMAPNLVFPKKENTNAEIFLKDHKDHAPFK